MRVNSPAFRPHSGMVCVFTIFILFPADPFAYPSRPRARSEEGYSSNNPTFYTNQMYSDIAKSSTYDAIKRVVESKKAKLEQYDEQPYDYSIGDYEELPYQSQSIRRLDGPFENFPEVLPEPEPPKKKLIKIKLKRPVDRSGLEYEEETYLRQPYSEFKIVKIDIVKPVKIS